jgi:hypothetical protein
MHRLAPDRHASANTARHVVKKTSVESTPTLRAQASHTEGAGAAHRHESHHRQENHSGGTMRGAGGGNGFRKCSFRIVRAGCAAIEAMLDGPRRSRDGGKPDPSNFWGAPFLMSTLQVKTTRTPCHNEGKRLQIQSEQTDAMPPCFSFDAKNANKNKRRTKKKRTFCIKAQACRARIDRKIIRCTSERTATPPSEGGYRETTKGAKPKPCDVGERVYTEPEPRHASRGDDGGRW